MPWHKNQCSDEGCLSKQTLCLTNHPFTLSEYNRASLHEMLLSCSFWRADAHPEQNCVWTVSAWRRLLIGAVLAGAALLFTPVTCIPYCCLCAAICLNKLSTWSPEQVLNTTSPSFDHFSCPSQENTPKNPLVSFTTLAHPSSCLLIRAYSSATIANLTTHEGITNLHLEEMVLDTIQNR